MEQPQSQKYEVVEIIGILGTKKRKDIYNTLELRKVRWRGSAPMYDLREWDPEGRPGKWITMTDEMAKQLKGLLVDHVSD